MPLFAENGGFVFHKGSEYSVNKVPSVVLNTPVARVKSDKVVFTESGTFFVGDAKGEKKRVLVIDGYLSLIPPLLAIIFAFVFKETVIALFLGIVSGVYILSGFRFFDAITLSLSETIVKSVATVDHVSIIIFTVLLGGMVGIIQKGGGTEAVINYFSSKIKSRKGAMLYAWLTGIAIFFDDYANTLIVGKTMQPITDAYGVSREKLSYIVDSTAAPVTVIAVISTWIGFEVSLLNDLFAKYQVNMDGYSAFIYSIPYLFYPILTLVFVFLIAFTEKDFGPMLKFEREAVKKAFLGEKTERKNFDTLSLVLGIVPVVSVIAVTLWGIYHTGHQNAESIREVFANSDSFSSLIWGSSAGCFIAAVLAFKKIGMRNIMEGWLEGLKSMTLAVVILSLAWSLGAICGDLKTGDYVISLFPENFPLFLHPMLAFLVSAIISFATGTSWGTMAIGYPLLIPLTINTPYLFPSVAAILSGAVFGDHCSPISDTTIMSSMSSGCNHINHVKTQLPYALTVAAVSMIFCYGLLFLQLPPFVDVAIGIAVLVTVIKFVGKPVEEKNENKGN